MIASLHREENVDHPERLQLLLDTLTAAAARYSLPVILSTHPRTRKRIEAIDARENEHLRFMKPFGFADYVRLQMDAFCVLSDSGTLTEESAILRFPAVMLREAHERPEGMDWGIVVMSGQSKSAILDAIEVTRTKPRGANIQGVSVPDYDSDHVSSIVVNAIFSYTDYINKNVWHK
jgi:UDP-N-acetylglucosamine 2-epimerase (non-hydrolysing)